MNSFNTVYSGNHRQQLNHHYNLAHGNFKVPSILKCTTVFEMSKKSTSESQWSMVIRKNVIWTQNVVGKSPQGLEVSIRGRIR